MTKDLKKLETSKESFQETFAEIVKRNPFDLENKFNITNLVTDTVKVKFLNPVVQSYLREGIEYITEQLKPTSSMKRIRLNFWNEYNKLHDRLTIGKTPCMLQKATALGPEKICHGVCHPDYFFDKFLSDDLCVAYMFTPPEDYMLCLQESLQTGVEKLRDILQFPLYEEVMVGTKQLSKPNVKVADIIIKTFAILDQRFHGAIPKVIHQRVQQETKNLNYNINNNTNSSASYNANNVDNLCDLEDLDARIDRIRKETNTIINNPKLLYNDKRYVEEQFEDEMDANIDGRDKEST